MLETMAANHQMCTKSESERTLDLEKVIIEPRKGTTEQPLPPFALMLFTPQDMDTFKKYVPNSKKRPRKLYLSEVFVGEIGKRSLSLVGPVLGAPQAVLILEKLIALGVREVLALGWCGSLQENVRIGDLVLPKGAYCEEGTSGHYPLQIENPGPTLHVMETLKEELIKEHLTVHEGMVWTTDAPFRETKGKVIRYREAGALGVDMETSALLTVAAYRSISLGVALVVSDELASLKWKHGFRDMKFVESRQKCINAIVRVIKAGC